MSNAFEHPWHGSGPHPWDDPLAPREPLAPVPGGEIAALSGSGPRPEEFPFDSLGRRAYYQAVQDEAARRQQLQQMQVLEQRQREEARREEEDRLAGFLLLL